MVPVIPGLSLPGRPPITLQNHPTEHLSSAVSRRRSRRSKRACVGSGRSTYSFVSDVSSPKIVGMVPVICMSFNVLHPRSAARAPCHNHRVSYRLSPALGSISHAATLPRREHVGSGRSTYSHFSFVTSRSSVGIVPVITSLPPTTLHQCKQIRLTPPPSNLEVTASALMSRRARVKGSQRHTYSFVSSVSCPTSVGTVPLSLWSYTVLRPHGPATARFNMPPPSKVTAGAARMGSGRSTYSHFSFVSRPTSVGILPVITSLAPTTLHPQQQRSAASVARIAPPLSWGERMWAQGGPLTALSTLSAAQPR